MKVLILILLLIPITIAQTCPQPTTLIAKGQGSYEDYRRDQQDLVNRNPTTLGYITRVFQTARDDCTANLRSGNDNSIEAKEQQCLQICAAAQGCYPVTTRAKNACKGNIATDCSPANMINFLGQLVNGVNCKVQDTADVTCQCKTATELHLAFSAYPASSFHTTVMTWLGGLI